MTSPSEPRTPRLYHAYDAAAAAKLAVGAVATLYLVQLVLVAARVLDLVASATSDLVVIGVLLAVARVSGGGGRVGLVRPRARFAIAAVLVGVSSWYPSLVVVTAIWREPSRHARALEQLTRGPSLGVTLVVIALLPAIAEELIFRGVLARGLATRLGPVWAILISSAAFGLYHLNPVQMIPTFVLGCSLALIAIRGTSTLPTMLAHALNNTIAIVVSRNALPLATAWIEQHTIAMLGGSLVVLAAGVALAIPRAVYGDRAT